MAAADYEVLAREHRARRAWSRDPESGRFRGESPGDLPRCVLCERRGCTRVFFPCDHLCVCDDCIEELNIGPARGARLPGGATPWHACPLCNAEIKLVLEYRGGMEVETYWRWVHSTRPVLPPGFRTRFRRVKAPRPRRPSLLARLKAALSSGSA